MGPRGEAGGEGSGACLVGVLVDGDVKAPFPGLLEESERLDALTPSRFTGGLVMAYLDGDTGFLPDLEGFLERLDEGLALSPDVGVVDAVVPGGDFGELGYLVGLREYPRWVNEAAAEAVGSGLHRLGGELLHPLKLPECGFSRLESHAGYPDCSVADEVDDVGAEALLLLLFEVLVEGGPGYLELDFGGEPARPSLLELVPEVRVDGGDAGAALARDDGGDALP